MAFREGRTGFMSAPEGRSGLEENPALGPTQAAPCVHPC